MAGEMLMIAHYDGGWCVVRIVPPDDPAPYTFAVVSGPHRDHADAVQAAETRAHRVAQGWAP